jgi:hypothetical protein
MFFDSVGNNNNILLPSIGSQPVVGYVQNTLLRRREKRTHAGAPALALPLFPDLASIPNKGWFKYILPAELCATSIFSLFRHFLLP